MLDWGTTLISVIQALLGLYTEGLFRVRLWVYSCRVTRQRPGNRNTSSVSAASAKASALPNGGDLAEEYIANVRHAV